ncbi:MAG: 16S rRNA (guanine(966)-N(2))-methyltransferase RsmD [Micrococcales bacterium]|nr:16S rRNA (guanine(966)-N(2))-methyltransferase RsmD [Micrococcales bacterium]
MTRIIAGAAGGRRIETPPGSGTRPTSDRVREALFSRLEALDAIEGRLVVDLYAGSGALGLEALSRGARGVILVEHDRRAAAVIKRNAASLGLSGARVASTTVDKALGSGGAGEVGLAMVDPPYDVGEEALARALTLLMPWLEADALVVVERSSRSPEPSWPDGLEATGSKSYGETVLWYAEVSAAA